ncbi:MAG: hypothetical protein U1E17_20810 [Geminicoccaceae bacterium]|mgnify:CR=1 FL=1
MSSQRRAALLEPDHAPLSVDWRAVASGWMVSTTFLVLLMLGA